MKRLILLSTLVGLSKFGNSQQINPHDTLIIRQAVTMQAQDIGWLRGKVGASSDSAIQWSDRNINTQMKTIQNLQWTTNVTVDSLPGKLALSFYQNFKRHRSELPDAQSTRISNALRGITVLLPWLNGVDEDYEIRRISSIATGKYIYVDL